MNRTKLIFLVALLIGTELVTSGYRFRCYAFCKNQTSIQDSYIEERDHCRQYAQLKSEMSSFSGQEKDRKAQLISMFSDCMSRRGWVVPDGRDGRPLPIDGKPDVGPNAQGVGASGSGAPAQDPVAAESERRSFIARASECNFARQNADVSSNAAARAKACDLECEHRLNAAPDAPRPAACPAELPDMLSEGHDG